MSDTEKEAIHIPFDEEAVVSMFKENLECCGTAYSLSIIDDFKDKEGYEWLVRKAEQRLLEIFAERLGKFNTSERAVEWFRDYHGLNVEAGGSE
ncbi:hypothetical protein [Salinibacter sp.]|uniref:hypothetical protein n=1 Tax=Salinibacter sp. TaxID=2065818 RepID=UPI0021E8D580|nr:hypothetical protein [Salinibacter sp.]